MNGIRSGRAVDPEIEALHQYWLGLCGDAAMPPPEALDPTQLKTYLSRVFLIEGGVLKDLRVRLAGTAYRDLYGREIAGMPIVDLLPPDRPEVRADYELCVQSGVPVAHDGQMTWREPQVPVTYQRILLPFGTAGTVERILGFAVFFDHTGRRMFR